MTRFAILMTAFSLLVPAVAGAADKVLKVGDVAPAFSALDQTGKDWKSADHVGKEILVVYFYPADMTGGCTKQACGYRDDLKKLEEKGVTVVGVSGDSVRNHQLFQKAHNLNFTLLADSAAAVADAFGVPNTKGEKTVEAEIDGKKEKLVRTATIQRWTFVIDKAGKIAYIDSKVAAAEDARKIAEAVSKLK